MESSCVACMIVGLVLMVEMMREGGKRLLSCRGGSRDLKPQRQSPKEGEGDKVEGVP